MEKEPASLNDILASDHGGTWRFAAMSECSCTSPCSFCELRNFTMVPENQNMKGTAPVSAALKRLEVSHDQWYRFLMESTPGCQCPMACILNSILLMEPSSFGKMSEFLLQTSENQLIKDEEPSDQHGHAAQREGSVNCLL